MKINKNILINIYLVLFIIYIFTNLNLGIQYPMLISIELFFIFIFICTRKKIKFSIIDLLLCLFVVLLGFSIVFSFNKEEALKYVFIMALLVINFIYFSKQEKINYRFLSNLILCFSGMHVFATIFYQLFPTVMQNILPFFLRGKELEYNIMVFNIQHINCGITPIQNANAMYIATFIGISFSNILDGKNKFRNIVFFIFGIIALLLASKRGVMLSAAIALFIEYMYITNRIKTNFFKKYLKLFFIAIIFLFIGRILIYNYFPDAMRIFERFTNQEDITTGRGHIYSVLFNYYINHNILLGNGLFSTRTILLNSLGSSNDAHNIYLQILVETGIPGICCFLAFIINVFSVIKKTVINNENRIICGFSIYYIVLFLIYGLSGNVLFDLSIVPMFLLAVIILLQNIKKEGIKK